MRQQVIEETIEKICVIRNRLKTIQSRQKSFPDQNQWEVEYDLDDYVFLKVSLMHGMTQFGINAKLTPRNVGPFENVERVGDIAYHLNLSLQLSHVHSVYHVSMLKKHTRNPSLLLPYTEIPIQADVTYEEQPTKIPTRDLRMLHNKETPIVKMHWQRRSEEKAIWELESEMYEKYSHLF